MTVRKYGTTWEFYGGKEYREASLYVSDSASDRFGGSGAGTAFKGNGGNDVIYGRGGDDVIAGGTGNDTLVGGSESDSFVFNTTLGSRNIDRITDFSRYQDDKIVLDNNVFVGLRLAPVDSSEVNNDLSILPVSSGRWSRSTFDRARLPLMRTIASSTTR